MSVPMAVGAGVQKKHSLNNDEQQEERPNFVDNDQRQEEIPNFLDN